MAATRTVRNVIDTALRKINQEDPGETHAAEDIEVGFAAFQDLIAEWSALGLMIPSIVTEGITLVINQVSYTVGENGTPSLNTVRPERITGAYVRDSSNYDYPVEIIGERAYRGFVSKSLSGSIPIVLWYNPTAPNGTVYVYPAPGTADTLYIVGEKPLTEATLTTQNVLTALGIPRNYVNPIVYNLALNLAPEFGVEPSQTIVGLAGRGLNSIRSLNAARRAQPAVIELAGTAGNEYNIFLE